MNYLLISGQGFGLGLALRLKQEGAKVAVWIKDGRFKPSYDNLLLKTSHWEDHLDANAAVLFDSVGGGRTAERLRNRGFRVLAGGTFADQLERDREVAVEVLKQGGLKLSAGPRSTLLEGWFDGKVWTGGFFQSFSLYRTWTGDLGPTGLAASVGWPIVYNDPLLDETLYKLTEVLQEREYVGPVGLDVSVDEKVLVTGITARLREESLPLQLELLEGPKASILGNSVYQDRIAASLVISIPPYPKEKGQAEEEAISGLSRDDREHLYFHDVLLAKDNQITSTKASGKLVSISGSGFSIMEAFEPVYEIANRMQVHDKQYRLDAHSELIYRHDVYTQARPVVKLEEEVDANLVDVPVGAVDASGGAS